MAEYPKGIEVERVVDLVVNFGWEKVKEELIGEELHLTIKKAFPAGVEAGIEPEAG